MNRFSTSQKWFFFVALANGLVLSSSTLAAKEYYKWVDQQGSTHYTTTPPPAGAKKRGKVDTYGWNQPMTTNSSSTQNREVADTPTTSNSVINTNSTGNSLVSTPAVSTTAHPSMTPRAAASGVTTQPSSSMPPLASTPPAQVIRN